MTKEKRLDMERGGKQRGEVRVRNCWRSGAGVVVMEGGAARKS